MNRCCRTLLLWVALLSIARNAPGQTVTTRWIDSSSGNWDDPKRWTAGVPTAKSIAVIDVAGKYTVNLPNALTAASVLCNNADALLVAAQTTISSSIEIRAGTLAVAENQALTLNGRLLNSGRVQMPSRDRTSVINGSGSIENSGTMEVYPVGGGGNEAQLHVPVTLTSSGRLLLSGGWADIGSGGAASGSGIIEIQADGRLRFDADTPARDLTVQSGMRLIGNGTLLMNGANRLVMAGAATAELKLVLADSARTAGTAILTLAGGQTLTGTYDSPVTIAKESITSAMNATFNSVLTVAPGGTLVVAENQAMTVNGKLLNQGKLALPSRDRTSVITGKGSIENAALIEVYPVGGGGNEAQFRLPMTITASGTLLLSGGWADFAVGSSLNAFGTVDLQKDGRLRFEAGDPRDMIVQKGAQLLGAGTLEFDGANRLVMLGDSAADLHLFLNESSRVAGEQTLTLDGTQNLTGVYDAPVRIVNGASINVLDATFNNTVAIEPGGTVTVAESRSMHLNGDLVNQGTLQLPSRDRLSGIDGTGQIENSGVVRVYPVGGGGNEAIFKVPMTITPFGELRLEGGWANFGGPGFLTVAGTIDIEGDGRLRFERNDLVRDVTLQIGAQLLGTGTLLMQGPNRVVMEADASAFFKLALADQSRTVGAATLSLMGAQTLTGRYESPVRIEKDAVVQVVNAIFTNLVTIGEGGTLTIMRDQKMELDGKLLNSGTLSMPSRDAPSRLEGLGFIENSGLIQIYPLGGGGNEASFGVPIILNSSGRLLLSKGWAAITGRGNVSGSGTIELQADGRLRFDADGPIHDLNVQKGLRLLGDGQLLMTGGNRLVMTSDATADLKLVFTDAAHSTGPGTLTLTGAQTLTGAYDSPVQMANGAVAAVVNATFNNLLTVVNGATLVVAENQGMTLNGKLLNQGKVALSSRDRSSRIAGKGSIENSALIEVYPVGGGGAETFFALPLTLTSSGTLLLSGGYANFTSGSKLNVFGTVDVEADGRLRFESTDIAHDLTVQTGGKLLGTGTLLFEGNNRLVMSGPSTAVLHFVLNDNSHVVGEQTLIATGQQTLTGVYDAPVRIATNANVVVNNATFNNTLTVEAGATLTIADNQSMHLNGKLANLGTVQLPSRDRFSLIDGAGLVENDSLLKVYPVGGGNNEAQFRIPITTTSAGSLVLDGGWANFQTRGTLRVEGTVDLRSDSRLRFSSDRQGDLTVASGAQLLGTGTLLMTEANRIVMEGDATALFKVVLQDSTRSTGVGLLSIAGSQTLTGTYDSPVRIEKDATVTLLNPTFNNLLTITPGATVVVAENNGVTVNGKIDNQGLLRLPSRDRTAVIQGTGFIANTGVIETYPVGGGGNEAHLQVPLLGTATGQLMLSGGYLTFESNGLLRSDNAIQISPDGRLRLTGSPHVAGTVTNRAGLLMQQGSTIQIHRFVQESGSTLDNQGSICADEFVNRGAAAGNAVAIGCVNGPHFPSISSIPDQRTPLGIALNPISFTVSDLDTPTTNLRVVAKSSNPALVQDSGLTITGNGGSRTLSVQPVSGQTGSAVVLVTVADPERGFDETAFSVTVYTAVQPNQPPVISVPGTQLILVNSSRTLSGVAVSDFDAGSGELRLQANAQFSTITLGTTDGLKVLSGQNGSASLEVVGTLDRLNLALAGLTLRPFHDYAGADTLTITVDDQGNSGTGGARQDTKNVLLSIVQSADVDSDGDGVPDAVELRAGTDPFNKNDFFGFQQPPKLNTSAGNLSLGFRTVPGKTYVLQSLNIGGLAGITTSNLSTVTATGTATTLLAPTSFKSSYQFFRVLLIENTTADAIPPVVSTLKAQPAGAGNYLVSLNAQDNTGVVSVDFEKDGTRIGSGVSAGNQLWQFTMPSLDLNRVYQITAVARDAAGNTVRSQPLRLFAANPLLLSPANPDGTPRLTEGIVANLDGSLPNVVFNPLAGAAGGASEGLRVQLPAGARVLVQNGAPQIQFTSATAQFSRNFALTLPSPLTVSGSTLHQLPLGPLNATNLAQAFGINPTNGLPVLVFGTLPLLWKEGTLRPDGIRGAKFSLGLSDLPLPKDSVTVADSLIELDTTEGVRIPLSGEFKMEDGSDSAAKLTVPASHPFVLTVRPDGTLALAGRAELEFKDGPHFSVDLSLADPKYALQISAEGLHIPMLGSLADALPSPVNVPDDATGDQLDTFARKFDALDASYRNFAAAASCTGDASGSSGSIPEPARVSSVIEAFVYAAIAAGSDAISLPRQIDLFVQSGRSAAASRATTPACQYYVALLRARLAMTDAFPDPTSAPVDEARASVINRVRQPGAIGTLAELQDAATCLLEVLEISQQIGGAASDLDLVSAIHDMIVDFISREAARLGVASGVNTPPANSPIAQMDRFSALQNLREVLSVVQLAQQVGVNTAETPLSEMAHQLAVQLWTLAKRTLNVAEQANDYAAFTAALPDALQVVQIAQSGIISEDVLIGPTTVELLDGLAARLQRVFDNDLNLPSRSEDLAIVKQDLRNLTRLLRQPNVSNEPWRAAAQRLSDRSETVMTQAFANLNTLSLADLNCLLLVGLSTAELRTVFEFSAATSWETNRLPQLVARFSDLAPQRKGWSELDGAVLALLEDAKRLSKTDDQGARRSYLARASELLATMRSVAVAVWQDADSCRRLNPALQLADMVLPGDILVDQASGGLSYNCATRELSGSLQGTMRLPEFDGTFTLANASISSGGAFDLTAFGSLSLPKDSHTATLSISGRQPFHVSFKPPHDLRIRGAAHLDIEGGPHFEAHVTLDDPLYGFGVSASGLRFHMATNLFGYVPVLDTNGIQTLGPDLRQLLGTYLENISATAEPLSSLTDPPKFAALGTPPDFSDSVLTLSTDPLNAALNGFMLILAAPAALGYVGANAATDDIRRTITPAVTNLVSDIDRESHRAASQLRKTKDDFEQAAIEEKDAARRRLADEISRAANAFSRIRVAETNASTAQQQGRLPQDGTTPGRTPGALDLCSSLAASFLSGLDDGGTLDDSVSVTNFLFSINNYISESQGLGCPESGLEVALGNFILEARTRSLSRYGFDANGSISDQNIFNALTDDQLDAAISDALLFEQSGQLAGADTGPVAEKVARTILQQRRAHLVTELQTLRNTKFPYGAYPDLDGLRQEKILELTVKLGNIHAQAQLLGIQYSGDQMRLDGTTGPLTIEQDFSNFIDLQGSTAGLLANYLDSSSPRFDAHYYDVFRRRIDAENLRKLKARELEKQLALAEGRPTLAPTALQNFRTALSDLAKRQIARLNESLNTPSFQFSLGETAEFAQRLLGLGRLLEHSGKQSSQNAPAASIHALQANLNIAELQTFQLQILPAFTARVTLLADAEKAWWVVARVNEVLLDGLAGKAQADLTLVQAAAADAAKDTLTLANGILKAVRDDVRLRNAPFNLPLPGEIDIVDVFGDVLYNRQTQLLRGSFGGRVELPNLNDAYFEISSATFDSRLNLSISANAGALNFGPGQLRNAAVNLKAGRDLPFHFDGDATMHFNIGPDVAVGLAYDQIAHELSFYTKADNLQTIRFGDQCVLFNAGLGVRVSTDQPQGQVTTSGTLGLFAKHALGTQITTNDFQLLIDQAQVLYAFDGVARTGVVQVLNGALKLPDNFTAGICSKVGTNERPVIRINSQQPITAALQLGEGHTDANPVIDSIRFSGALTFSDIGMAIPQLSGLAAEMCDGRIDLPTIELDNNTLSLESLPHFHVAQGNLTFPLPPGQTNRAVIRNADFDFSSLPTGTVFLESDMKVMDFGDSFQFFVLGGESCGAGQPATGLSVSYDGNTPVFQINGGVKLHVSSNVLQNDMQNPPATNAPPDADVALTACARLTLKEGALPDLFFPKVRLDGNFRLAGGVALRNAFIELLNLNNIFETNVAPQNPFTIALGGTILVPDGPGFGLKDCKFVFNNLKPEFPGLPQFVPGTLIYDGSQWTLMHDYSFLQVDSATLTFKKGDANFPQILSPTNIIISTTARVVIPTPDDPIIGGGVNDLKVTFAPDGYPLFSLDGIGFDVQPGKLKIPPINDLGGRLYIGGLSDPVHHPERLFFAGKVTGTYSEMKLGFLAAFKPTGPIGLCLDVKGGSLGIPLPFGFIINGGAGGISLVSNNSDPCDMRAYIDSQSGKPTNDVPSNVSPITWQQFKDMVAQLEDRARRLTNSIQQLPLSPAERGETQLVHALAQAEPTINCPAGCPPYTVNIFCQPHPTIAGRVIVKFSSIEESTLNRFGITRDHIADLLANGVSTADALGNQLAAEVRTQIAQSVPLPPAGSDAEPLFNSLFDLIQSGFAVAVKAALANTGTTADAIYAQVRDTVYAGLTCGDQTYKVAGTFSHSAIGMFLSITGEALFSTTGTAGVSGHLNFLGLPVGTGKVFIAATDDHGNPNPSLCGEVKITLGPLDIGVMSAALRCDNCVSGIASIFGNLALGLSQDTIQNILDQIAPQYRDVAPADLPARLKPELQAAFLAVLLQNSADSLPSDVKQRFITAVANALTQFDPEFVICGKVQPRLFGIPLGPELVDASYRMSKQGRQGQVGFAPSEIVCLIMDPRFCAPVDKATLGYNEPFPNFDAAIVAGLNGTLFDPALAAAFAKEQLRSLLENVSMTATYELAPLGLKLARAQARAVMPDFTAHPLIRPGGWQRPEQIGLPSRTNLLQAMLRANLLGDPFWVGKIGDLPVLYPGDDPTNSLVRQQLQTRSLTHDYFPYGGVIGAGYFDVPRALFEAPPAEFYTALNPASNVLIRVTSALTFVNDYLLKNTNIGQISFYIPAPNPPVLNGDPETMLASMTNFDLSLIHNAQLYPLSESFLGGFVRARLLGVDLGSGVIEGVPPGNGQDAYLRGQAQIASDPNNWLKLFVDDASLSFEIRQSPTQAVEKTFTAWATLINSTATKLQSHQMTDADAFSQTVGPFMDALYSELPKAKLEARLDNVHIPPQLQPFLQIAPTASLSLQAFSPRFDPLTTGDSPSALARQNGGIVIKGDLTFGNFATIPNAELAVLPKPYDPLGTTVPPDLAGELSIASATLPGGMVLQNGILSFNSAIRRLRVSGQINEIDLVPLFKVVPLDAARNLGASVDFQAGGSTLSSTASINPAKLLLPVISPDRIVIVSGATTNDPFTFSSSAPWSANVSILDTLPLEFKTGTNVLFSIVRSNVSSMKLQRDMNGTITFAITNAPGTQITFFPGKPIQQSFRLSLSSVVIARTDGTFSLSGALADDLPLGASLGLPAAQIGRTASVSFERVQDSTSPDGFDVRLTLVGSASGGLLPTGVVAANAQLRLSSRHGADLTGTVSMPPLAFQKLRIEPVGTNVFAATLSRSGVALSTGTARLVYDGTIVCQFPLANALQPLVFPADVLALPKGEGEINALNFTLPTSGDFGFTVSTPSFALFNFPLGQTAFTFGRTNGVATVTVNSSQLAVGAGNIPSLNMGGTLNSDGTFALSNRASIAPITLGNLPITSASNGSAILQRQLQSDKSFLTQFVLTANVTGGVLDTLTLVHAVSGTFNVRYVQQSTGAFAPSLVFSAQALVQPLAVPNASSPVFVIDNPNDSAGNIVASINNQSLRLSSAQLRVPAIFSESFAVNGLLISPNGDFTRDIGPFDLSIPAPNGKYSLAKAGFALVRSAGTWSLKKFSADLTLPGLPVVPRVSGTINGDSSFTLSSSANLNVPISGWAVANVANATATIAREFVTRRFLSGWETTIKLSGDLSGGALGRASFVDSARGEIDFDSGGVTGGTLTLNGIEFSPFRIESADSNPLSAALEQGQLRFASHSARLKWNGVSIAEFSLPSTTPFLLPTVGDFSFGVSGIDLTLFNVTLSNGAFNFGLASSIPGVRNISGTVSYPVVGSLTFNGRVTATDFNISATPSFNLGNWSVQGTKFDLSSQGVTGSGKLQITDQLQVPIDFTGVTSSGLTFSGVTAEKDTGWQLKWDSPAPPPTFIVPNPPNPRLGDIYGRLQYTIAASASNFTGTGFKVEINGTIGGWVDPNLPNVGPPDDITSTAHFSIPQIETDSGGINIGLPDDAAWNSIKANIGNFSFGLW